MGDSRLTAREIEDVTLVAIITRQYYCHLAPSFCFYLPLSTEQARLAKVKLND